MAGKVFVVGLMIAVVLMVGLTVLSTDPTYQVSLYRQLLDVELSRQLDGSYQPAVLMLSRANLPGEVRARLYDIYATTPVQLEFSDSEQFEVTKLIPLERRQNQNRIVHSFVFGQLHYRNGWPGMDVTYLSSGGKRFTYTAHLRYTDKIWEIVEKIAIRE